MTSSIKVQEGHQETGALSDQSLLLPGQWEQAERISHASGFLVPVGIHWVERDVLNVSEEIASRFPNLRVASCTCNRCERDGHFPHVVLELGRNGQTYPVFGFRHFGPHVIERLHQIRSGELEAESLKNNKKVRAAQKQAVAENRAEHLEIIEAALKSPKQDWRGPKGLRTRAY